MEPVWFVLDHLNETDNPNLVITMSPLQSCLEGSKELTDAGAKLEIRVKRKKANRKAQKKTKSRGEYVAHLINSRSNSGVIAGARDGACLRIWSRPLKVNFNSGVS